MTHFGDKYPEVEKILIRYVPRHYDEFLRVHITPRKRNKRGDYKTENPMYMSGLFLAILEVIDPESHAIYKKYLIEVYLPLVERAPHWTTFSATSFPPI
jgi:hypothetical protein